MRTNYLTPSKTYNRRAIMLPAWAKARALAKAFREGPAPFRREITPRALFAGQLRQVWNSARGERDFALWAAEQKAGAAAETARRAALSDRDRRIEDAESALTIAEHADRFTAANNAAVLAARAQIASLHATA